MVAGADPRSGLNGGRFGVGAGGGRAASSLGAPTETTSEEPTTSDGTMGSGSGLTMAGPTRGSALAFEAGLLRLT
jgi:hypothetical protein